MLGFILAILSLSAVNSRHEEESLMSHRFEVRSRLRGQHRARINAQFQLTEPEGNNEPVLAAGYVHILVLVGDSLLGSGVNDLGQLGVPCEGKVGCMMRCNKTLTKEERPVKIEAGGYHTLWVLNNGTSYSFGFNYFGQLGIGSKQASHYPVEIFLPGGQAVFDLAAGEYHSLVLTGDNRVYSFGRNREGQLGLGHTQDQYSPEEVTLPSGEKAVHIAAGGKHSFIVTKTPDGKRKVYSFGLNKNGQLGLGHNKNVNEPTEVDLSDFQARPFQIAAGGHHTMILFRNRSLCGFGLNRNRQLGLMDYKDRNICTSPEILGLIPNGDRPIEIAAGGSHTLVLKESGELYGFGLQTEGQIGQGFFNVPIRFRNQGVLDEVAKISVGWAYSVVLLRNNTLILFGDNSVGSLNIVSEGHSLQEGENVLDADGNGRLRKYPMRKRHDEF